MLKHMIGKGKPNGWRVCVKASFGRGAPVHLVRDHLSTVGLHQSLRKLCLNRLAAFMDTAIHCIHTGRSGTQVQFEALHMGQS